MPRRFANKLTVDNKSEWVSEVYLSLLMCDYHFSLTLKVLVLSEVNSAVSYNLLIIWICLCVKIVFNMSSCIFYFLKINQSWKSEKIRSTLWFNLNRAVPYIHIALLYSKIHLTPARLCNFTMTVNIGMTLHLDILNVYYLSCNYWHHYYYVLRMVVIKIEVIITTVFCR